MKSWILIAFKLLAALCVCSTTSAKEILGRGVIAVMGADGSMLVSWRLLHDDPPDVVFNVYGEPATGPAQKLNSQPITDSTNFHIASGSSFPKYFVTSLSPTAQQSQSESVEVWRSGYLPIPISPIEGYRPGDASFGDLDGDGEWEIVLHQVSNPKDNGSAGMTGEPILDAYRLDGTLLWRINLGKNIREGEHYTQFLVYDFDGDGRAELICKTADGTVEGTGEVIGDGEKDWRNFEAGSQSYGRILKGPEFLTIFDGLTGKAMATVDYIPSRDPIDGWGGIGGNGGNDRYGNRCDRFLACVAYLEGERPSAVMCRGVYGRIAMAAWDWDGKNLKSRWVFDSGVSRPPFQDASPYSGMGGHSLSVADVDEDGRDEIVYQAMVVDDDGKGLYSSGLRHGDAMHVTDMDPSHPGQEIFTITENEEPTDRFMTPGAALRDAKTGEILWSHSPGIDVPSGLAGDIDPRHPGYEIWSHPGGLRTVHGELIGESPRLKDFVIWWDGDLLRELLDRRGQVYKWNYQQGREEPIFRHDGVGAPRGVNLMGDLLGDWREEFIVVSPDGKELRLYSTSIPTNHRIPCLLEDRQYRLGLVWQNVVYNKPPHPSFFLGEGMFDVLKGR